MHRKFYVWIGVFRNNLCENSQMIEFQFDESKEKITKLPRFIDVVISTTFGVQSFLPRFVDSYKTSIIYDIDRKVRILTSNVLANM